ncbi:MAG: hypothetical protein AAFR61_25870 [Bacteroidota bacterium]
MKVTEQKWWLVWLMNMVALGSAFGQEYCGTARYQGEVFTQLNIQRDIPYGKNVFGSDSLELKLDFFEPFADTADMRPLIIWAFGGAFVTGSKGDDDVQILSEEFARRGYACASINYRTSIELLLNRNERLVYLAVMKVVHDLKAAVRFFRKDAANNKLYKIDPNRIYVGGLSSGAISAMHLAYMRTTAEFPTIIQPDTSTIGGVEGFSGNPGFSSEVAGVINISGALGDTLMMDSAEAPIISIHGTEDPIVPYGTGNINLLGLLVGVDGSASVDLRAKNLGIAQEMVTFLDAGHTPMSPGDDPNDSLYMDTTLLAITDFMYQRLCEPIVSDLEPDFALDVQLFPNPASTHLFLKGTFEDPGLTLQMIDAQGRFFRPPYRISSQQIDIDLSALAAGIFFLSLRDSKGRQLWSGKVLKRSF